MSTNDSAADFEFDVDTHVNPTSPSNVYDASVTDRWNIGPNPNGGYLIAIAARAIAHALPDHPDPFTVSAHYLRPGEVGPASVSVEVVRTGRKIANVRSTLSQGGKAKLEIIAAYGDLTERAGPTVVASTPPTIPGPDECVKRTGQFTSDGTTFSSFGSRMDTRLHPDTGFFRGQPSGNACVDGWIRFIDGREPDALSLLLFADAFPPAVFEVLGTAGWVPTIELTVHVRKRPVPGWLQVRMQTRYLVDGYFEEDGEIWDATGALVCQSRQLGMIFRP